MDLSSALTYVWTFKPNESHQIVLESKCLAESVEAKLIIVSTSFKRFIDPEFQMI